VTTLKFTKTREVKSPARGTAGSAGIDFFVPSDFNKGYPSKIFPGAACKIPSGIKADVPDGYALVAFNKSGVALKKNLMVGASVVDSDYQGEIHLHVINVGPHDVSINSGEKLIQFLLLPVDHCDLEEVPEGELFNAETQRGSGGFGSTGAA